MGGDGSERRNRTGKKGRVREGRGLREEYILLTSECLLMEGMEVETRVRKEMSVVKEAVREET